MGDTFINNDLKRLCDHPKEGYLSQQPVMVLALSVKIRISTIYNNPEAIRLPI